MKNDEYDKDAVTDVEIFQECKARLEIATEAEGMNRQDALDDLNFVDGDQWPSDISNGRKIEGRPALTINHTETFVNRVINNIKSQRPRIKCHPVGDGADIAKAEVINGLIRHIETLSNASVAYDQAAEMAVKIGWGYWRIVPEYIDDKSFEQELKIKPVMNAFTCYDDPAAVMPDGSDRDWFIISEKMKRTKYKALYPKAENSEWQSIGQGDNDLDWESKEEIRLAEYFRITETPDVLYRMTDGSTCYKSALPSQESMDAAKYQIATEDGEQISRPTTRRMVQWFRLNGKKVVDKRTLPGRHIPMIRVQGNVLDLNGRKKRKGMVRNLKDPARMYNYWRTAETERYALAPKAPWIVAEGQTDGHPEWDDANRKAYSRLVYKPVTGAAGEAVPPPIRQNPLQIEAGMAEAAAGAEHDLMAVAGMPHEPGQDSPGQVISGKAIARRQALSDMSHFQYFDNLTMSIAYTGTQILDLIPYYYDTARMQRIIGEDGVPSMEQINQKVMDPQTQAITEIKNDLTVGRYDVVMDTGPGYQTKREEGSEAMLALVGTPELGKKIADVGADLIVRAIDAPYMEDLADRLAVQTPDGLKKAVEGLPKQAQAIVTSLQAQNQQLQQALQHAQLELKYKATIEQGWMHVEREKQHLTAETKVHDTNVKSETARDVAEIQAGASLLNTHAEAKHNEKAAELMIKQAEKTASKPN